jgi:hypothetical protein
LIEYITYQQWRCQPSFPQLPKERLREKDNWVVWKMKDNKWTHELQWVGFHQILSLDKNTRGGCWGNKIKGWWWKGDIKATKCKRIRECGVRSPVNVSSEVVKDIKETLMTLEQNYGKDRYTIDLTGPEATYWIGTESVLLGSFHFDGSCTVGDGSCDVTSLSIDKDFYNLNSLK